MSVDAIYASGDVSIFWTCLNTVEIGDTVDATSIQRRLTEAMGPTERSTSTNG